MKSLNPAFIYPRIMKILGLAILLFASTGMLYQYSFREIVDTTTPFNLMSLGLFFIFFSREKIEDERVHQIKFRALTAGFLTAYLSMYSFTVFSYTLAVHEFIVMVLIIATVTFYIAKSRQ
jgi:hypothetical protein